jgi:hypothetical protein
MLGCIVSSRLSRAKVLFALLEFELSMIVESVIDTYSIVLILAFKDQLAVRVDLRDKGKLSVRAALLSVS